SLRMYSHTHSASETQASATDAVSTPIDYEAIGRELDALRERVLADLGERDVAYIRKVIDAQRRLELTGRGLLFASWFPPAFFAGTAMLGVAKILDNMEIGHNIMHGQYDFAGDPTLSSREFDWDTVCPAAE